MLSVGITGGIGSGKTTVCKIFETLHIPVYYADDAAKWLMENDTRLITALKQQFGEDIYTEHGKLNRPLLAGLVFNNPDFLKKLESLVHPAVKKHGQQWQAKQNAPYTLKEAALLYEAGTYKELDKTIVVFAPLQTRIDRVIQRDHTTKEAVMARINKQMPDEDKMKMADFVIYNNGSQLLIPQVLTIHQTLLQLSNVKR